MRIASLLFLSFAAACGGNSGPTHWKDQPLEAVSGTVDGTAYSIELPKGMTKSKSGEEWQYHQDKGGESYAFAPSVNISKRKPMTLDEALKDEKEPVLDKQSTSTGWAYSTENSSYKGKEDYLIDSQSGELYCSARVYPMKKGESVKDLIPLVEKMCLSLKTK